MMPRGRSCGTCTSRYGWRDAGSESVGETRGKWLCRVFRPAGARSRSSRSTTRTACCGATCDWGWPEHRLLGEFDGKVKYGRLLEPGQDAGRGRLRREAPRGRPARDHRVRHGAPHLERLRPTAPHRGPDRATAAAAADGSRLTDSAPPRYAGQRRFPRHAAHVELRSVRLHTVMNDGAQHRRHPGDRLARVVACPRPAEQPTLTDGDRHAAGVARGRRRGGRGGARRGDPHWFGGPPTA